jgi:hypothetical protein
MPDMNTADTQPSLASLFGGLIEDTQRLVRQEAALARRELSEELEKTKYGAGLLAGAFVLLTQVGMLLAFTLVTLLQHFVLPNQEWACFAIVTALFVLGSGLLAWAGISMFQRVHVVPPRTAESLREDVQAVTSAIAADRSQGNALLRQR